MVNRVTAWLPCGGRNKWIKSLDRKDSIICLRAITNNYCHCWLICHRFNSLLILTRKWQNSQMSTIFHLPRRHELVCFIKKKKSHTWQWGISKRLLEKTIKLNQFYVDGYTNLWTPNMNTLILCNCYINDLVNTLQCMPGKS